MARNLFDRSRQEEPEEGDHKVKPVHDPRVDDLLKKRKVPYVLDEVLPLDEKYPSGHVEELGDIFLEDPVQPVEKTIREHRREQHNIFRGEN